MYMVLVLKTELEAQRAEHITVSLKNKEQGLAGMIPVFTTYDDARRFYPDKEIYAIKEIK